MKFFKQFSFFLLISTCLSIQSGYCADINSRTFVFEISPTIEPSSSDKMSSGLMFAEQAQLKLVSQSASKDHPPRQRNPEISENDLVIIAYDENGLEISRSLIADPRFIRYESFDEITGKFIAADEIQRKAGFNVTLPENNDLSSIEVFKPYWNGKQFILHSQGFSYVDHQ